MSALLSVKRFMTPILNHVALYMILAEGALLQSF